MSPAVTDDDGDELVIGFEMDVVDDAPTVSPLTFGYKLLFPSWSKPALYSDEILSDIADTGYVDELESNNANRCTSVGVGHAESVVVSL